MRKIFLKTPLFILLVCINLSQAHAQETEILWDNYGVPHIYGKNAVEMYHAFGWAQMHNHANMLLKLYGQARGRAAEYWGQNYFLSDQKIQLFNIPEKALAVYRDQDKEYKAYLDAFVEGINAYAEKHPEAIEEQNKQVLPVTVGDVIAHTLRVTYLEFLGQEDIHLAHAALNAGSNAVAIAPSRSASGNAMLIINPHLPWSDFFTWFEAHLNCAGFSVYGVALVGMPTITMAFNENLGWAHTVNPIDASDRYELTLSNGGYILDGKLEKFQTRRVTIKVRQADASIVDHEIEFKYSKQGPVLGQKDNKAYAVRIAGMDNTGVFKQYHLMAEAKNFKEFESAAKMLQNPMFNVIYADRDGNIFYLFNGNIPKRKSGDFTFWKGTIDGTQSKYIWKKTHPYKDLPKLLNPSTGFIQNCNDAPWFCTDPPLLNPGDFPPYFSTKWTFLRPQHAVNMISPNHSITYNDLLGYKHNTEMEAADRFLDDLLKSVEDYPDSNALEAAAVLEKWDKQTEVDSRGAVLFVKWFDKMRSSMYKVPWDPENPFHTPDGIKEEEKAVQLLVDAASEVKELYGTLDVAWGEVYRFRVNNYDYPANGGPGEYGLFRTIYYMADVDHKMRAIAGESFVSVVEFGENLKANVILAYGNASQAGSKHTGDQLKMLSEKKLRPALLSRDEILNNTEEKESFSFNK